MKNYHKILFGIILSLAIFFRLYRLDSLPAGLNWDEISHGYTAYSILNTGKDQWGTSLPIFNFRAYGDFPTTLNMYLTIPFIKLFGLTSLAIRLPTVIFSIIFVIYTYLFSKLVLKNKSLALISMSLAAFLPWSFFPSRGVFQSTLSQTLLLVGLYYFYLSFKKPHILWLSAFMLGLSTYSYHNTRIIVPLLIPLLFFLYPRHLSKTFKLPLFILLIILLPNILNLFTPDSFARNRWVGIINPNSVNLINAKRNAFTGPEFVNRLINNRPVYFVETLTLNYLNLLNPFPLFIAGTQNQQLSVPGFGVIFPVLMPFLYIGLIVCLITPQYLHLIILTLVSLLPAAMTIGDFPVLRASTSLIFYIIFITLGISKIKRLPSIIPILAIFVFFVIYWFKYLSYNQTYSSTWQYGYKEIVQYAKDNYQKYDQIIVTKKYGEPHEFFLFFWPWNPDKYQNDPKLATDFHADWYWVNGFDKFTFKNDWEIKSLSPTSKTLLITSPQNYPTANSHHLKTVNFLNETPAFDIISYE